MTFREREGSGVRAGTAGSKEIRQPEGTAQTVTPARTRPALWLCRGVGSPQAGGPVRKTARMETVSQGRGPWTLVLGGRHLSVLRPTKGPCAPPAPRLGPAPAPPPAPQHGAHRSDKATTASLDPLGCSPELPLPRVCTGQRKPDPAVVGGAWLWGAHFPPTYFHLPSCLDPEEKPRPPAPLGGGAPRGPPRLGSWAGVPGHGTLTSCA